MGQADPAPITPALSAADLNTTINHEPRIMDLRLAEALGFAIPRMIRKLVERHRSALERYGEVCSMVEQTSRRGGRPSTTYWLNRSQAIHLCAQSQTERASEITIHVVTVFMACMASPAAAPSPEPKALPAPEAGDPASLRLGALFATACCTQQQWIKEGIVADRETALWIAFQAVLDVAGVEAPISHLAGLRRRR